MEKETVKPDFWKDKENAQRISEELGELNEEIELWGGLEKEALEMLEILEMLEKEKDESLINEIAGKYNDLEKKFKKEETKLFLGGKYDKGNAILSIYSGAGGIDAQDWASILLRMYQRFCENRGWLTKTLHHHFGEEQGTKNVTIEVKGKFVYGYLRGEAGVHRLVRISPFSPQKLRHTSFALVEVLPEIDKDIEKELSIKPEDLKIDLYRASGPGGQNVNRRETAVRITHLPTGFVAACQSERSQLQNRDRAMKLLYAKLYERERKKKEEEERRLKGESLSPEWGSQIRSYVLHPYKMVKDHRTNTEVSDAEAVLDGEIDEFIEANISLIKH